MNLDRPDTKANETFVILTFSGGGSRAAAFSYGVLRRLRADRLGEGEGAPRVLDEVDIISSVSGGSFTAAYYGLFGEAIFEDYEDRFLRVDIESELARLLLNPLNWVRLLSPWFSRIDLAAEYYDDRIFANRTYSSLARARSRPFILVNATHLSTGDRFTFVQSDFDPLCADLGPVPVARGVAASSAFPGLLSPITLENRAGTCKYEEEEWIELALDPDAPTRPARRMAEANRVRDLEDAEHHHWVHLIDGGVADNIGLRGPLWAITTVDGPWSALARMNLEEINRLVVVVVDAKTEPETDLGKRRRTPRLVKTLHAAATVPMGQYSFDTVELFRDHVTRANQDAALAARCSASGVCPEGAEFHMVEYYPLHVHFDAERNPTLRDRLKNMGTNFALDPEDVDLLIDAGGRLLGEVSEYQRLLQDMR